jgi:hypothetical protein
VIEVVSSSFLTGLASGRGPSSGSLARILQVNAAKRTRVEEMVEGILAFGGEHHLIDGQAGEDLGVFVHALTGGDFARFVFSVGELHFNGGLAVFFGDCRSGDGEGLFVVVGYHFDVALHAPADGRIYRELDSEGGLVIASAIWNLIKLGELGFERLIDESLDGGCRGVSDFQEQALVLSDRAVEREGSGGRNEGHESPLTRKAAIFHEELGGFSE